MYLPLWTPHLTPLSLLQSFPLAEHKPWSGMHEPMSPCRKNPSARYMRPQSSIFLCFFWTSWLMLLTRSASVHRQARLIIIIIMVFWSGCRSDYQHEAYHGWVVQFRGGTTVQLEPLSRPERILLTLRRVWQIWRKNVLCGQTGKGKQSRCLPQLIERWACGGERGTSWNAATCLSPVCKRARMPPSVCKQVVVSVLDVSCVGAEWASNPATSAQVNTGVTLRLPSSALPRPSRLLFVVFSSPLLFVSPWHHKVKPLACSSLEIPTPAVFPHVPLFPCAARRPDKHPVRLTFLGYSYRLHIHHLLTGAQIIPHLWSSPRWVSHQTCVNFGGIGVDWIDFSLIYSFYYWSKINTSHSTQF